ncbi:alpha/beta hydrolase-fold protein [Qipengyuania sp. ASV99]|uniref:alpha/beta hydrolase-fold protein n=1 Tax=Qipengyuania sp. ASV99 TaxID=3399681 RepID=UPI003A4C6CF5
MRTALFSLMLILPVSSVQASEPQPYEMPRTEVVPIQDSGADRQYELYIKLPEDYADNPDTKYPVIYTTDAVVHMDMLSGATEFLMPDVILVGISYQKDFGDEWPHASRFRDYTVTAFDNPEYQARFQAGQAGHHLDFIRNEVMPYVESTYRTDPRENTYFGYSLGAAFGAYTLLARPDTFKNYILGSPAFSQRGLQYIDELEAETALRQDTANVNVFVSLGELEESEVEEVGHFMRVLRRRDRSDITLMGLEIIEGSNHSTAFPETVVRAVRWLFDRSSKPDQYLGQIPPGSTPERFAPGLVSTEHWEYGGTFSPDMKEFYFLKDGGTEQTSFIVFKYQDNQWQETVISPRVGQPFISPDGQTMHLGKRYMDRVEGGWSERRELGGELENFPIMRLTASSQGTYVFDEFTRDGDGLLRYSRLVDGNREAPKPFGEAINSGTYNGHPFIAPDESYIIWDSKRDGGFGDSDIYISFRRSDGTWGDAINLGDRVNTDAWEASPSVTPDGKYLFFNRNIGSDAYENVDIYWVDAQVIEDLKPAN